MTLWLAERMTYQSRPLQHRGLSRLAYIAYTSPLAALTLSYPPTHRKMCARTMYRCALPRTGLCRRGLP
ncbi:hypothetical protein LIPSTDRAFT_108350 [Lipomyces starkeyi NRRL Y-11557]|uniref:Uncharacterized protein n=1 Tax=Lipomyces starkeyi NRRL Y-11557 TaxID=675824 RepID=A0A1E3PTN1_LIPST|nr:hypothetical protein LIPSTDRAFT_108350 [Lipomyces starkeyi NRRL Y-11557]